MNIEERRPIPDGRIRLGRKLTEDQAKALRTLNIDGLLILNFNEVDFSPPETWIEYWFDRDTISETDLRVKIEEALYSSTGN